MKEKSGIIDISKFKNYSEFMKNLIRMERNKENNVYSVYVEIDGHKAGTNYNSLTYLCEDAFKNDIHIFSKCLFYKLCNRRIESI